MKDHDKLQQRNFKIVSIFSQEMLVNCSMNFIENNGIVVMSIQILDQFLSR